MPGKRVTIPAGTYFLGDPCYAIPHEKFGAVLEAANGFEGSPVAKIDGREMVAFAFGVDGEYFDNEGQAYCVDAGMIGLTPIELAQERNNPLLPRLGRTVTFGQPTECSCDKGVLTFGPYVIKTGRRR